MSRGIRGTFAIDWSQCEVDGMSGLTPNDLGKGARWLWRGKPTRLDGAQGLLPLGQPIGSQELKSRAARSVRKLIADVVQVRDRRWTDGLDREDEPSVHLTDGRNSFFMHIITSSFTQFVVFEDSLPPEGEELWVVSIPDRQPEVHNPARHDGLTCLDQNAQIDTPIGPRPLGQLNVGDLVTSFHQGPTQIVWMGTLNVSGARLNMMPQFQPVRIKAGALGQGQPVREMLVSARQRILVKGRVALDLFNTDEVLVAAKDLVNGRTIFLDSRVREVQYRMILLARHDIIRADHLLVESFHPGKANLDYLDPSDHIQLMPVLESIGGAGHYGVDAARGLSSSEAEIFKFAQSR